MMAASLPRLHARTTIPLFAIAQGRCLFYHSQSPPGHWKTATAGKPQATSPYTI
jgi:hypothetical protein